MALTTKEFMDRLESISVYENKPYGRCFLLFEEESSYGASAANEMSGYLSLSDAFKCFYLETVERINTECRPKVKTPLSEFYPMFFARLNNNFETLVAAERVALHGYPHQAFTMHRNNFDNAVLTAGAMQGFTDFYSIEGLVPGQAFDERSMKALRKKTEFAIQDIMLGSKSGMSQSTVDALSKINHAFDLEVHGSRLSLAKAADWLKGVAPLRIMPTFEPRTFSLHMNRYLEVAWMVCRMIPLIQPPEAQLSADWPEKWRVLDDSFQLICDAMTKECGKPFGAAFIEFVQNKFPFTAESVFPLK
ncbi:hypothetical protein [Zoogloea sp. LCSB751]|uniref:hypothetical protein n=1 Tax=Zoogloea sp. LCSB751 TaxID=1965277 RepID=UPI0009A51419|nr:hypothetical protein [Zoogloea sp. LCSB751]